MSEPVTNQPRLWPNGKRIAIAINVDLEVWSPGNAPSYSVQTSSVKPGTTSHGGITWSRYGGISGVWRIISMLQRHRIPGNFSINAACVHEFPEAVAAISKAGFDISGHGYTQDQLLAYMSPDEEQQTIKKCLDLLESAAGFRPTGWVTPVHAHSDRTFELLADEGVLWHNEAADSDRPHVVNVSGRRMVAIPGSDFTDNRVLKTAPHLLLDTYKRTFSYLYAHEPMAYLGLSIHSQFGGRPLMTAAFDELIIFFKSFPDVWFATHGEIARYVMQANLTDPSNARILLERNNALDIPR